MGWVEISPSHWQRRIGENESMIRMIGDGGSKHGKDTWSIFATARFAAQLGAATSLTETLRDGWRALRFRHPSIAMTAAGDSIDYHVPSANDVEQWVDETFIVLDDDQGLDRLVVNLGPRRYATCYYLRKQWTVLLHLSHWRTDGIGAFHLLNALFAEAIDLLREDPTQLTWGGEVTRLVPSVEEGLGLATIPTEAVKRATNNYVKTLGHTSGAVDIALQPGQGAATTGTIFTDLGFPQEQTAKMESACHQLDIKLDSALHASVAAAAYSIAEPGTKDRHHCSTMRHSLRPHLPAPFDGAPGAAGLYTAGYMVRVPSSNSWLENANYYESEYCRGATLDLLCSRRQYAKVMKGILANMAPTNPPPGGLDVSVIPNAQDLVCTTHSNGRGQSVQVEKIGVGVEVLSRHMYVFAWVFDGQLSLRLVCNRAFYDKLYAAKVLELVKEQLVLKLLS